MGKSLFKSEEGCFYKKNKVNWLYRYAIAAENAGKITLFKSVLDDIYHLNGNDHRKHYRSGVLLLGFSRPKEAERCFRRAIELDSSKYNYYIGLAISLNKQGKSKSWQEAMALESAIALNPYSAEAHFSLGMNYETMHNYYMASICYIKAISFKIKKESKLKKYINKIKENKKEKNIILSKITKELPSVFFDAESHYNNGILKIFTSPSEAEDSIRKAIELNSKDHHYYTALAESLKQQGEAKLWQEHEALLSAITLGCKDPNALFRLGMIKEKMQSYVNACEAYSCALDNGLSNLELHYRLGYCLEMLGNIEKASEAYSNAISYDDKLKSHRFGIGVLHNKYNHRDLAILALKQRTLSSQDDAELFYNLGMTYDRCYDWKNANKSYKRAVKLNSNIFEWQFRLAFTFERLNNYKEASYWYEKAAFGRSRHTPYWFYRLGYALSLSGEYKKSCEAFINVSNDLLPVQPDKKTNNEADTLLFDAITFEHKERYDHALLLLRDAIKKRKGKAGKYKYRIGCILYKKGLYQQASLEFINMRVVKDAHGVSDKAYRERDDISLLCDYNKYYYEYNIEENVILYESFHGASISCNPLALYLALAKDVRFKDYNHYFVINSFADIPSYIKEQDGIYFIARNSDIYLEKLATAKILINNSTFPTYFIKKEGQLYINTWHGTPLKTLGRDMKSRFLEHKNFTRNILQSDLLISPNAFTTRVLKESHDISGIYGGEIFESGYPRIDLTLSNSRERILSQLDINSENKVVFYAPTWRGTHGDIDFDTSKLVNDLEQLSLISNIAVVFRGHSLLEDLLSGISIKNVHILNKKIDTNEFLSCVDILITDYSSILFDFFPRKKPIIYYAYDLKEYSEDRGLYLELDSLPGQICHDIHTLLQSVKTSLNDDIAEQYDAAISVYNSHDDGYSSLRVVDKLYTLINNKERPNVDERKKISYLFYAGPFMRNGITTSFINLANNLARNECAVSVVVDPGSINKYQERLDLISRLDTNVNIIGRVGGMNFNIEERYIHAERNRKLTLPNDEMQSIWNKSWQMEFKRIFGNAKFDFIVNFEGYSNFWAALFGSCTKIPNTIYQHNDMMGEMNQKYPYLRGTFDSYQDFKRIISVSKETCLHNRSSLCSHFNLDENKFVYSENLLNLDSIFILAQQDIPNEDKGLYDISGKIFINIGRLSIEKDQAKLIYAFKNLIDAGEDAKLIILGEGPLKSELLILINELQLQDKVHLLGHRDNPYPYLLRAHCFVLSSNHEGQPMTLLEALTLNKDIIATSIPGNNSVLSLIQETGVENSVYGLTDALIGYCRTVKKQRTFNYKEYQVKAIERFFSVTGYKI